MIEMRFRKFDIWMLKCCTKQQTFFLFPQCSVISKQQYARWREQGLAFEMREGVYQISNPSLLSSRVFRQVSFFCTMFLHNAARRRRKGTFLLSGQKGGKVSYRGYWGDIVSSPYLSFGIETDDKNLLRTQNGQHISVKYPVAITQITC